MTIQYPVARRFKKAGAAAALAAALIGGSVGAAPAAAQTDPAEQGTAILTPVLKILVFGTSVGLPTGCQLVTSLIGTTASQLQLSTEVSPLLLAMNEQCSAVQAQGSEVVASAMANSTALNGINSVANPAIASVASTFEKVGQDYGPALAPFGPTISGMSGFISFFAGS